MEQASSGQEKFQKYELDWKYYSTYHNMYKIYIELYNYMSESGVDIQLKDPICFYKYCNEVYQSQYVGRKVTHCLIHPDFTLHTDEDGGKTK